MTEIGRLVTAILYCRSKFTPAFSDFQPHFSTIHATVVLSLKKKKKKKTRWRLSFIKALSAAHWAPLSVREGLAVKPYACLVSFSSIKKMYEQGIQTEWITGCDD